MEKQTIKKTILFGAGYIIIKWTLIGLVGGYLYRNGYWSNWFFLLIPVIGLTLFKVFGKHFFKKDKFQAGFRKQFYSVLKTQYSKHFDDLMENTESAFIEISKDTHFATKSSNPMDKRLDFSAYFLALIQVLEKQGESFEKIRTVCLEVATEYVKPKNAFQKWAKKIPVKLAQTPIAKPAYKLMHKKVSKKGHEDGFLVNVITDKKETYGFGYGLDIIECGICKLFHKHNADKYSTILCEVDKLTSSLAGLELVRTDTISNGAEKCDFRFKKV